MLVNERDACLMLAGAGLSRTRARRLLGTGIAGDGARLGHVVAYEVSRVLPLRDWPVLGDDAVRRAHRAGVWVGRAAADRPVLVTAEPDVLLEQLAVPWRLPWLSAVTLTAMCRIRPMPFVAAVSGYVVAGADLHGAESISSTHARLQLAAPGAWWSDVAGHRLPPGRGAPPLQLWSPGSPAGGPDAGAVRVPRER